MKTITDRILQSVLLTGFYRINPKNRSTIKKWRAIIGGSTEVDDSALDILSKFTVKLLEEAVKHKEGNCNNEWFKKLFDLAVTAEIGFESEEYRKHLYNTYWFYVRSEITAERRKMTVRKERESAVAKMISSPDFAIKMDNIINNLSTEEKMVALWKLEILSLEELGCSERTIYRIWNDIKKDQNNFNTKIVSGN